MLKCILRTEMFSLNENYPEKFSKGKWVSTSFVIFLFFGCQFFWGGSTFILFFKNNPIIYEPDYVVKFTGFNYFSVF